MNTIDNDIKKLLKDYRPTLSDSDAFMETLDQRLDAVEEVKQYHSATRKSYWTGSIIAFVVGLALGAFALFVVLFRPASLTQLRLAMEGVFLRFFAFWEVFLALAVLIAAVLVIVPLIRERKHSFQNI